MDLNTMLCIIFTLTLVSGLYNRIMIKVIRTRFNKQDKYTSYIDYGIEEADYKPFKFMKFLRLSFLVNSEFFYKFMRIIYFLQVLLSVIGFIMLLVLNYFDKYEVLNIKF